MASAPAGRERLRNDGRPGLRPPELQDGLNRYLYHPLAARLARLLAPTPVTPNFVSVSGLRPRWGAVWAYLGLGWPQGALLGFLLHAAWHVTDGADGDLARLKGTSSATGELVHGVCDYAGHTVMYFAFAFLLDDWLGVWAWVLAVAAGASHIAQTNHAETQRRTYLWWAYGVHGSSTPATAATRCSRRRAFSATFSWMARDVPAARDCAGARHRRGRCGGGRGSRRPAPDPAHPPAGGPRPASRSNSRRRSAPTRRRC